MGSTHRNGVAATSCVIVFVTASSMSDPSALNAIHRNGLPAFDFSWTWVCISLPSSGITGACLRILRR